MSGSLPSPLLSATTLAPHTPLRRIRRLRAHRRARLTKTTLRTRKFGSVVLLFFFPLFGTIPTSLSFSDPHRHDQPPPPPPLTRKPAVGPRRWGLPRFDTRSLPPLSLSRTRIKHAIPPYTHYLQVIYTPIFALVPPTPVCVFVSLAPIVSSACTSHILTLSRRTAL